MNDPLDIATPFSFDENRNLQSFYRGYRLKLSSDDQKRIGEIYSHDVRVAYCEAVSSLSSLQHLRDVADQLILDKMTERKNAIPSANETTHAIENAYRHILPVGQRLIAYFQDTGRKSFSMEELMLFADAESTFEITLSLAEMGRLICDIVGFEPPAQLDGRDPYLAVVVLPTENCANSNMPVRLSLTKSFYLSLKQLLNPLAQQYGYRTS